METPGGISTRLFSELGVASGHAPVVSRDSASALHYMLQPTMSAMEPDLDCGNGHSQEVGDLRRSEGVGFVQQNYSAVFIRQEIQTPLNACAGFFPLRNVEWRRKLRNRRLKAMFAFFAVQGNQWLALSQAVEAHVCGDAVQPAPNGIWIA